MRVLLVALERRVARHRPALRIVVVEVRLADLVDVLEVVGEVVAHRVEVARRVHRPQRRTLLARAVVRDQDDQRVVAASELLEVRDQPPQMQIGVLEHAGVGGLEADREAALVVR